MVKTFRFGIYIGCGSELNRNRMVKIKKEGISLK